MSQHAHELTKKLIQCPSVTPNEAGALDLLEGELKKLGFEITRLSFGKGKAQVQNLFARLGKGIPHFCFAGHVDVVPAGDENTWCAPPFEARIIGEKIIGRGAVDMKGAIACFIAALSDWLNENQNFGGSISLAITCDEEGVAQHGTREIVAWLNAQNQMPDAVLVGEPTNPESIGDAIKYGRRGSLSCALTVYGEQGHVAYPHLADNPLPRLINMLAPLTDGKLDKGNADFDPSTAAITSIDTGNEAGNVIPAQAHAQFNIRFGTAQNPAELEKKLRQHFDAVGGKYEAKFHLSAEAFATKKGNFTNLIADAIHDITEKRPKFSTSGGTSDARFFAPFTEVLEFGLVGKSMHKIDEAVALQDLTLLTKIYHRILQRFFA